MAGEQRREIHPAEREHGRGLGDAHAHRVAVTAEQPDLADDFARAGSPDLHRATAGHAQRRRESAVDDEQHLPRGVALLPESLALRNLPTAQHPCELRQVRVVPTLEEWNGGEEVDRFAVRHRGRASRTRARPT